MLGIVVSLSRELKSLTRQTIPVGSWKAITDNTLVALSGIGADRAYMAGSVLVSQGATALLSWGCAAALDDRVSPGCLILPERIIGANGEIHRVSTEWHRRLYLALESKHSVRTEALVESDVIVKTSAEKRSLARRTQAAATDMESAAQARLAKDYGLPFIAIRAIVDTPSTEIPENVLKALDPEGNINLWKLLSSTMPADWIKIVRLGIQFNAAQRTL
ncbi:MAG TPA: phosphorylase, partial [Candidatus Binatia bacterium]|nr:phosphorylase [Candidatus Binatia bacterium]